MRHDLSRRQTLSLGVFSALGVLGASCGSQDSPLSRGTGGSGDSGAGGGSTGGSSGNGGSTGGSGGATGGAGGSTGGSGGATGGSGGFTGGGGGSTSGAGGSTGGSGGNTGGAGGSTGGSGGATGGSGGATGGSGGSTGGAGGSTGGASGSGGSTGGSAGNGGASGSGSMDAGSADASNTGCGLAVVALISLNHPTPHELTIPPQDIAAGVDKIYNSRGLCNHDHFVLVTAADFATLKAGGTVIKKSCNGIDHEYVLSCAPPSRQPVAPTTCTDECGLTMTTLCPP